MWKPIDLTDPQELKALIVREARGVLDEGADILNATCKIHACLGRLGFDRDDPDYHVFAGIETEIDDLPIGAERDNWSAEALARKEPQVQAARAWAVEIGGLEACRRAIARFSTPTAEPGEDDPSPSGRDA